jgi:4-diphosphocytidyl-2-C-methyl-D-erythritol kinase
MKIKNLYDELYFEKKDFDDFLIRGDFDCDIKQNTIYKAYLALLDYTKSTKLKDLMKNYGIVVKKNIPSFAGLGGGSSDAACFLKMCNEVLMLELSLDELASIGSKVGADVAFFVYGYDSANVSGIGEVVERFEEKALDLEIYTPKIKISTPAVYKKYRESFYNPISQEEAKHLLSMSSRDVLASMNMKDANDLYLPAVSLYEDLKKYSKEGWFFSGSGSSFFTLIS